MITLVYICNMCKGKPESRSFEVEYRDMREAGAAPTPSCPVCHSSRRVTRFFGHNIFAPGKKNRSRPPEGFEPLDAGHKKAVVSVGMRVDDESEREAVEKSIREIAGQVPVEMMDDPNVDIPEVKLGLKKGTLDRALFDIRHRNMIDELAAGKKISGFYLPITGDSNN